MSVTWCKTLQNINNHFESFFPLNHDMPKLCSMFIGDRTKSCFSRMHTLYYTGLYYVINFEGKIHPHK